MQIPSTLRDSLSERLDRLGSAKEVAQIAAAFGREFSSDLVAATFGRTVADLDHDRGKRIRAFPLDLATKRCSLTGVARIAEPDAPGLAGLKGRSRSLGD